MTWIRVVLTMVAGFIAVFAAASEEVIVARIYHGEGIITKCEDPLGTGRYICVTNANCFFFLDYAIPLDIYMYVYWEYFNEGVGCYEKKIAVYDAPRVEFDRREDGVIVVTARSYEEKDVVTSCELTPNEEGLYLCTVKSGDVFLVNSIASVGEYIHVYTELLDEKVTGGGYAYKTRTAAYTFPQDEF